MSTHTIHDYERDLDIIAKAARHGEPPDAYRPVTDAGKRTLEDVLLLGRVAKGQREFAVALQAKADTSGDGGHADARPDKPICTPAEIANGTCTR